MKNFKSNLPCVCCGESGYNMVCFHHLKTRKRYPELAHDDRNLISVCQVHHVMFHNLGTLRMSECFEGVRLFLIEKGWEKCPLAKKWILPKVAE